MRTDQCYTNDGLGKLLISLKTRVQQHQPLPNDTFVAMIETAQRLENDKLLEQCRLASSRCEEISNMVALRQNVLQQALDQLKEQGLEIDFVTESEQLGSNNIPMPITSYCTYAYCDSHASSIVMDTVTSDESVNRSNSSNSEPCDLDTVQLELGPTLQSSSPSTAMQQYQDGFEDWPSNINMVDSPVWELQSTSNTSTMSSFSDLNSFNNRSTNVTSSGSLHNVFNLQCEKCISSSECNVHSPYFFDEKDILTSNSYSKPFNFLLKPLTCTSNASYASMILSASSSNAVYSSGASSTKNESLSKCHSADARLRKTMSLPPMTVGNFEDKSVIVNSTLGPREQTLRRCSTVPVATTDSTMLLSEKLLGLRHDCPEERLLSMITGHSDSYSR